MKPNDPTKEELQGEFEYQDGILWRKDRVWRKKRIVNNIDNSKGYCRIKFKDRNIYYHRIIWILHFGEIPSNMCIDHINGNTLDNRIENLRAVTVRKNQQNRKAHRSGKLIGCYFNKNTGRWVARARVSNCSISLGSYSTELEAYNAYIKFLEDNRID